MKAAYATVDGLSGLLARAVLQRAAAVRCGAAGALGLATAGQLQREITDADIEAQQARDVAYQYGALRRLIAEFELEEQTLKQARQVKAANVMALSQALSAKRGRYNEAKKLIAGMDAVSSDAEKAKVLFSSGFGRSLADAREQAKAAFTAAAQSGKPSAAATRAHVVLGRTDDTWKVQNPEGTKAILNVDPSYYTLALNDAFMRGGLDLKAEFGLATPLQEATKALLRREDVTSADLVAYATQVKAGERLLWSDWGGGQPSVSCRELGQLVDDGYRYFAIPAVKAQKKGEVDQPAMQMMVPRQSKSLLQEIRTAKGTPQRRVAPSPKAKTKAMEFWRVLEQQAKDQNLKTKPSKESRGRL